MNIKLVVRYEENIKHWTINVSDISYNQFLLLIFLESLETYSLLLKLNLSENNVVNFLSSWDHVISCLPIFSCDNCLNTRLAQCLTKNNMTTIFNLL